MWNKIGEVPLETNEMMEIYMVKAPDEYYRNSIASFLAPKKRIWMWHLKLSLCGELDKLKSRFYLGLLKDKIISNVSTWEHGSIGIVGHLFTTKNHRRKGACATLMKTAIRDFRKRGGKILIGGFKETSYPIAKSLGFKSIINNSEVMRYDLCPDFEREYFRAEKTFCREPLWKDWPGLSLLFTIKDGWRVRSVRHKIFGPFDYEDYFLEDMREQLKGICISKVLVTEKENIVGYASLASKHRFKNSFWLLDFFTHPAHVSNADIMLEDIHWPKGNIRCYVEANCSEKRQMLLKRGFREKTILKKRTRHRGEALDIIEVESLKQ